MSGRKRLCNTVHAVTSQHSLNHEWLRMEELKRSLAWLWPNFRETTVMGHFVFSTTIENGTLLTVTLGWNPGALLPDIELTDTFIPRYIRKLEKLGYQYDVLSFPAYYRRAGTQTQEKATAHGHAEEAAGAGSLSSRTYPAKLCGP